MSSPSSIPLSSVVPEGAVTEVPDVAEQIVPKPELSTIPPQYVIPITPDNQLSPALIPSYPSLGSTHERNFDHNDQKYQCCHGHMHITLAARVVSIAYLCTSLFAVSVAVTSQGVTFAFCSIASVAFTLAIFGTLAYGVFTEKQTFILPYIIFQVS
uniref:CASP-like protein n=1 Tax=Setaria digitata TaxID=48799 RepID=A0A915PWJ4_9BILA